MRAEGGERSGGDPIDRIVLVGFMCSGKSTVGPLLARRLDWEFVDFDAEIETAERRSIAEIFSDQGERFFRSLEAEMTRRFEARGDLVLAPGGGWITQPELVARLRPRSRTIWLRARPETIYRRHRAQVRVVRPLLDTPDPLERIGLLLAERTPLYRQADIAIDTDDRGPADIAEEIERRLTISPRT